MSYIVIIIQLLWKCSYVIIILWSAIYLEIMINHLFINFTNCSLFVLAFKLEISRKNVVDHIV